MLCRPSRLALPLLLLGAMLAPSVAQDAPPAVAKADVKPKPALTDPIVIDRCLVTIFEHVQVPAREAGVLESLLVREGDLIEAGQAIGKLDLELPALEKRQAEFELQVARKQAENDVNIRFAKAAWEVAKAHVRRAEEANRKVSGSLTEAEVQERQLSADKAELQIEQATHEMEVAKVTQQAKAGLVELADAKLRRRAIAAPTKGMVVELYKRAGEWLNPGDPVVRVLRIDKLRVEGFVSADKSGASTAGKSVTVESTLADGRRETFAGKVVFVSPEIEPVTNQVRVWAEVDNPKLLLRPGARASMTILPAAAP